MKTFAIAVGLLLVMRFMTSCGEPDTEVVVGAPPSGPKCDAACQEQKEERYASIQAKIDEGMQERADCANAEEAFQNAVSDAETDGNTVTGPPVQVYGGLGAARYERYLRGIERELKRHCG